MNASYAYANGGQPGALRPALTLHMGRNEPLSARRNRLLACLPEASWQRLQAHLEEVDLPLGKVLCQPGGRLTHAVFPTTAIVSLLYLTANGGSAEIAVVGNEGMVGTWVPMGGGTTCAQAVVQSAGRGFRMSANLLTQEFNRSGPLGHLLLRYMQAVHTQTAQIAVCNRHHSLEHRLCHWLMLRLDRLDSNHIAMTHEMIANLLGVRRESVTEVAGQLQKAGLISYQRGDITVLDRKRLEAHGCECYRVVKNEYDRLLPAEVAS